MSHGPNGQLPATLRARLSEYAARIPSRTAYTFLREGEQAAETLSYAELSKRVSAFASHVAARSTPGERLILIYQQGLDFLVAFLGCLEAGAVAVPVSLPNRHRGVSVLSAIARDSGAIAILSERALLERMETSLAADEVLAHVPRFATENWREAISGLWVVPEFDAASPALIQYTSGSTGTPRGVLVSHENLLNNQRQIQETCGYDENSVAVSWLPLFHDMGLGVALMTVVAGMHGILMSPSAFLQKPIRWLRAISDHRASFSCAPDFGYDLCARRVSPSECAGLDLSSWTMALNGSEPVRSATFERFVTAFAPYGFRGENYKPVYGLAEATLMVTGDAPGRAPTVRRFSNELLENGKASAPRASSDASRALIGCGQPRAGAGVLIVDPQTLLQCEVGSIGEIWVSGPSIAVGYWGLGAISDSTFRAQMADGSGPFLRTGDLGFWDDGCLFITGRIKDLIIVRGRNHYPQDLEATVSGCHPALEPQRCAAFSVDGEEGEQLVIVQELKRSALRAVDTTDVFRAISNAVSREHGLQTHSIVLIRPSSLPRTTSGKVQRKVCARSFLEHSLSEVAAWGSAGSVSTESDSVREAAGRLSVGATRLMDWLGEQLSKPRDQSVAEGPLWEPAPEFAVALTQHGALALRGEQRDGGLGLSVAEATSVLEQLGELDLKLSGFIAATNSGEQFANAQVPPRAHLDPRLALAAASAGALKSCELLARRHSPYFGRALRKKLTPDPDVLAQLGALTSRVVALDAIVQRTAELLDAGKSMPDEVIAACQIASMGMLEDSLEDLVQLAAMGSDASEAQRIARLEDAATALWQTNETAEEVTRRLGVQVLHDREALTRLSASLSGAAAPTPLVTRTTHSLLRQIAMLEGARISHYLEHRLGMLTSWLALLAAAEAKRQEAPAPDLDRACAWVRSQLDSALSELRSSGLAEAPSLDSERPVAAQPPLSRQPSAPELRALLVTWISRRMRIPEAQVVPARAFADYGLDSVAAVELAKALSDKLGRPFDDTLLWNFPTIDALIEHLVVSPSEPEPTRAARTPTPQKPEEAAQSSVDEELERLEAELKRRS